METYLTLHQKKKKQKTKKKTRKQSTNRQGFEKLKSLHKWAEVEKYT